MKIPLHFAALLALLTSTSWAFAPLARPFSLRPLYSTDSPDDLESSSDESSAPPPERIVIQCDQFPMDQRMTGAWADPTPAAPRPVSYFKDFDQGAGGGAASRPPLPKSEPPRTAGLGPGLLLEPKFGTPEDVREAMPPPEETRVSEPEPPRTVSYFELMAERVAAERAKAEKAATPLPPTESEPEKAAAPSVGSDLDRTSEAQASSPFFAKTVTEPKKEAAVPTKSVSEKKKAVPKAEATSFFAKTVTEPKKEAAPAKSVSEPKKAAPEAKATSSPPAKTVTEPKKAVATPPPAKSVSEPKKAAPEAKAMSPPPAKTVTEPKKAAVEPKATSPTPVKSVSESKKVAPEAKATSPAPAKTVTEPKKAAATPPPAKSVTEPKKAAPEAKVTSPPPAESANYKVTKAVFEDTVTSPPKSVSESKKAVPEAKATSSPPPKSVSESKKAAAPEAKATSPPFPPPAESVSEPKKAAPSSVATPPPAKSVSESTEAAPKAKATSPPLQSPAKSVSEPKKAAASTVATPPPAKSVSESQKTAPEAKATSPPTKSVSESKKAAAAPLPEKSVSEKIKKAVSEATATSPPSESVRESPPVKRKTFTLKMNNPETSMIPPPPPLGAGTSTGPTPVKRVDTKPLKTAAQATKSVDVSREEKEVAPVSSDMVAPEAPPVESSSDAGTSPEKEKTPGAASKPPQSTESTTKKPQPFFAKSDKPKPSGDAFETKVKKLFEAAPKATQYDVMINLIFPGALSNEQLKFRVVKELTTKGYTPDNTLLATSLCCDELARCLEKELVNIYGKNFNLGGLAGFPFAGNTGFGAMAAHIPDDGSVLIVYGPHVGVATTGGVGKVERRGIELVDNCCGSAIAASNYLKGITDGGAQVTSKIKRFTDFQQNAVQKLILPHAKRLSDADDRMRELPFALYDSQDLFMRYIVKRGAGGVKNKIALLGGIQINTAPEALDYFLPLRFDYMNNKGEVIEDMLEKITYL